MRLTIGVGVFCTGKRGWVGCDTTPENAFFEFFQRRLSTCPTPGAPCIPLRWIPQPPAHPDGLHSTGSSTGRARCKADHAHSRPRTAHTPGRWTRCTGLHSIPDRPRRVDRDGAGGLEGVCSASETVQNRTRQNQKNKYAKKRKYLLTFTQESV
nr:MAG TPA: hypothetical protein [Bacteriophage sp.]